MSAAREARSRDLFDALAHVRAASERFEREDGDAPTGPEPVAAAILSGGSPEEPKADDPASDGPK